MVAVFESKKADSRKQPGPGTSTSHGDSSTLEKALRQLSIYMLIGFYQRWSIGIYLEEMVGFIQEGSVLILYIGKVVEETLQDPNSEQVRVCGSKGGPVRLKLVSQVLLPQHLLMVLHRHCSQPEPPGNCVLSNNVFWPCCRCRMSSGRSVTKSWDASPLLVALSWLSQKNSWRDVNGVNDKISMM